ncbi:MAG: hypothetical protein JRG71_09565, partial [Deltaproteobacteria bacterium]|nr:hypothetical protein [Deltaproteobacteria bacterium]
MEILQKIRKVGVGCAVLTLLVLSACQPFTPSPRVDQVVALPDHYSLYSVRQAESGNWWYDFGWQDLDQLVEKGLAQNLTLHETWARLQQSQAQVLKSRAS